MSTDKTLTPADKAAAKIAELIIERMEQLKDQQWQKSWFGGGYQGKPMNLSGREYQGGNTTFLNLVTALKGHEIPVFTTFNEAKNEGLNITKGAKSVPIMYYGVQYKDETGKRVSEADYRNMSAEEQQKISRTPVLKKHDVFNVADTNLRELQPERYAQLQAHYRPTRSQDTQGMYSNAPLDRMFEKQEWSTPIEIRPSKSAYYVPSEDKIVLPEKAQFKQGDTPDKLYNSGMSFYSTALHEMAHSTGHSSRLDRSLEGKSDIKAYAREELVAELSAAVVGQQLGFDKKLSDDNAKYLNHWVEVLKEQPRFILNVLSDVSKASTMIMEQVEVQKQKLELGEQQAIRKPSYRDEKIDVELNSNVDLTRFSNSRINIEKTGEDSYRITSDLRLYNSEISDFVRRYLKGHLPKGDVYTTGPASSIHGIYYYPPKEKELDAKQMTEARQSPTVPAPALTERYKTKEEAVVATKAVIERIATDLNISSANITVQDKMQTSTPVVGVSLPISEGKDAKYTLHFDVKFSPSADGQGYKTDQSTLYQDSFAKGYGSWLTKLHESPNHNVSHATLLAHAQNTVENALKSGHKLYEANQERSTAITPPPKEVKQEQVAATTKPEQPLTFQQEHERNKAKHPDALMIYRDGANYVMYGKDAEKAADILKLQTEKITNKNWPDSIERLEFHHSKLEDNLKGLVKAGQRVGLNDSPMPPTLDIKDATLVHHKNGDYAVRAKVDGMDTGLLPVDKKDAMAYLSISNSVLKENHLQGMVASVFKSHQPVEQQPSVTLKR